MKAQLFVDCRNALAEGPFWNRFVKRLFWFDVPAATLYSADESGRIVDRFPFKSTPTAGAALDAERIMVATDQGIEILTLSSGASTLHLPIEADRPETRSNDGRLHPSGSLWISTMGRRGRHDQGAGTLYLVREGAFEPILEGVTIPNATCFSPDGGRGYFADTLSGVIRTVPLDPQTGRPTGPWSDFARFERGMPDGAVVDSAGYLWSARWGGSCVVRFSPDGRVDRVVELPVSRVTCPAFGGDDLRTLYIATAREGMSEQEKEAEPEAGSLFYLRVDVPGQADPVPRL